MNGLSLSELCYLFCCPPCPSRITAKLAFLPPAPTYAFIEEDSPSSSASSNSSSSPPASNCSLHLTEKAEWQYSRSELEVIDVFYTRSRRGNRVACMYVKITDSPEFTILFSHGNAVDLGQMSSFFIGLGNRINCNILAYDYSGYGASTGKASEANIYSDAEAAWETLKTRFGLRSDQVILYGQSIGTAATVDLATRHEVAGVVLHSPLMSGMRVACPDVRRTWCFDSFASIEKITRVTSPVLVIHGTDDEVIDFTHGLALFERAPRTVEPLWVEGAGHNDVELYGQYLDRLRKFIQVDIRSS